MDNNEKIEALQGTLNIAAMMLGQITGILVIRDIITPAESETFSAGFSTGSLSNNEFMDHFRSGLDKMMALRFPEEPPSPV